MKQTLFSQAAAMRIALASLCLATLGDAHAGGIAYSISLERYTLVDGDTFQYDTGFLRSDGSFEVITSLDLSYSMFGLSPDFIAPFSGKPMMNEDLYNAYHSQGLIPNWIRSQDDYEIGFAYYVAVAIKGKGDPNPSIAIGTQPESQVSAIGEYAFFYVLADSYGDITYQWKHRGKDLPGQTDFMLTITNVTALDAGVYTVALSTGGKPILSKPALLKLDKLVSIRTQPKSLTVKAGRPAVFRVALSGSPPFTYQWYRGLDTITNATKSFYTIPHAELADEGNYYVIVSNPVWSTYSAEATLIVTP